MYIFALSENAIAHTHKKARDQPRFYHLKIHDLFHLAVNHDFTSLIVCDIQEVAIQ